MGERVRFTRATSNEPTTISITHDVELHRKRPSFDTSPRILGIELQEERPSFDLYPQICVGAFVEPLRETVEMIGVVHKAAFTQLKLGINESVDIDHVGAGIRGAPH